MKRHPYVFISLILFTLLTTSCSKRNTIPNDATQQSDMPEVATSQENQSILAKPRDNTPVCLVPVAGKTMLFTSEVATIDASNASEGYLIVTYVGTSPKVKLQITGPNEVTYTYNLSSHAEVFPLSTGNGDYQISIFENVSGNQYSTAMSEHIFVDITNTFGPFLYPNQYVDFNINSESVQLAADLSKNCTNELDVVSSIYNYVISNISYDYDKAENIKSGYIPNIDEILVKKTGICLDYASLMASMLRSQQIPTRLEVGYAGDVYHAWISTYLANVGWVNGIIKFNGKTWTLMDPTFAANTSEKELKDFIGDGSNYTLKYIY